MTPLQRIDRAEGALAADVEPGHGHDGGLGEDDPESGDGGAGRKEIARKVLSWDDLHYATPSGRVSSI